MYAIGTRERLVLVIRRLRRTEEENQALKALVRDLRAELRMIHQENGWKLPEHLR